MQMIWPISANRISILWIPAKIFNLYAIKFFAIAPCFLVREDRAALALFPHRSVFSFETTRSLRDVSTHRYISINDSRPHRTEESIDKTSYPQQSRLLSFGLHVAEARVKDRWRKVRVKIGTNPRRPGGVREIGKSQSSETSPPSPSLVRAIYSTRLITTTRVESGWGEQQSTARSGEGGAQLSRCYDTPATRTQVKPGREKGGWIIARDIAVIYESRSLNRETPLAQIAPLCRHDSPREFHGSLTPRRRMGKCRYDSLRPPRRHNFQIHWDSLVLLM